MRIETLSDNELWQSEEGIQDDMDLVGDPESGSYSKTEWQRLHGILLQVHAEMQKRGMFQ